MFSFRTEIHLQPSALRISHQNRLVTLGSCFSNSIGDKFIENKFDCLVNPFGTLFNPISIHHVIGLALSNSFPEENSFLTNQGVWKNFHFHSSYHGKSKEALEEKIRFALTSFNDFLQKANCLILTYGTAFVFECKSNQEIIANCHKQSSSNFIKRLLTVEEIVDSFKALIKSLQQLNPSIKIIVTISPVRHTKDTLELNTVSKSILRLASHRLSELGIDYFPAFEMVMDDLRDYRFYEADMIHVNQQAIDYIWSKFSDRYFSRSTNDFLVQWKEVRAAMNHKPFDPESQSYKKFLERTIEELIELNAFVDTDNEVEQVEALLMKFENRSIDTQQ